MTAMDLISRPNYYNKLNKLLGKGVLIVLTGQRRVGKSYVMKELVARKGEEPGANVIFIDKLDEFNLGYMFYFFMRACAMSAYMLEINPFNQPGVEVYKKNMFHLLGKKGY